MKFDIRSWIAVLAIILAIIGSNVGLVVWMDSKLDALHVDINRSHAETQALLIGLIAKLEEQSVEGD